MRYLMIAIMLLAMACGQEITGLDVEPSSTQTITYVCVADEAVASFIGYSNTDSTSTSLADVPLPFIISVEIPVGAVVQISMTKTDPTSTASVCIIRDGEVISSDVGRPGDSELWCRAR